MNNRYQDFVFRDGKFVGQFEQMYRSSAEVPWHQDETANAIFSDITVAILRRCRPSSMLDVGCGLGYFTERVRAEIPTLSSVVGVDISPTAIDKAQRMFPSIRFLAGTLEELSLPERTFDVVSSKDVIWYVLDGLAGYVERLARLSRRFVYIGQSFPDRRPYYGESVLPDAAALLGFLAQHGYRTAYSAIEVDSQYGGREYLHALIEVET